MPASVNNGSAFVGGGVAVPKSIASDQWPDNSLSDTVDATTSVRTAINATASATPHTVGSWVEIDPSLSFDCAGLILWPGLTTAVSATDSSTLVNIGTGGSGSEVTWATIGAGYGFATSSAPSGGPIIVPGFIAAGTRTAIQCQSAIASQAVRFTVEFIPANKGQNPGTPITYQANTATSRGLTLTAPGSLNTKGAWLEIVSSTATALSALTVCPQAAGSTDLANNGVLIDIGIGAAGFETAVIKDLFIFGDTSERYYVRSMMTHGLYIPTGTRLSARYARANAKNTVDLVVIGTRI